MEKRHRQDGFDYIRLIAALMVLVGHAFIIMGGESPIFLRVIGIHLFGVMIFFSISGYLIADSWVRDQSVLRYLARRSLRLVPALIPVILLTTFLLGPALTTLSLREYLINSKTYAYLGNIFLYLQLSLPEVFPNNPIPLRVNSSLWTLDIEFLMYLLLPALSFLRGRKNALIFIISTCLFAIANTFFEIGGPEKALGIDNAVLITNIANTTKVSMCFMAGAAVRYALGGKKIPLGLAAGVFILTIGLHYFTTANPYLLNILLAFSLPCFINALGDLPKVDLPSLNRIGDLSYGVYLYAFPIQQIIAQFLIGQVSVLTAILLATFPTVFFAYASWHLIEKKALALKPKTRSR